ncbi:DUF1516 family protein [Secundilactobacillus muriivasis]|jgi:hypothetical protein
MWLLIHFISLILLIPFTIIGLSRHSEKRIAQFLILNRLVYLSLLISGVVLVIRTFQHAPMLVSFKALLEVFVVILIELTFGRKQERSLSKRWLTGFMILVLLTAALGIWLTLQSI